MSSPHVFVGTDEHEGGVAPQSPFIFQPDGMLFPVCCMLPVGDNPLMLSLSF